MVHFFGLGFLLRKKDIPARLLSPIVSRDQIAAEEGRREGKNLYDRQTYRLIDVRRIRSPDGTNVASKKEEVVVIGERGKGSRAKKSPDQDSHEDFLSSSSLHPKIEHSSF